MRVLIFAPNYLPATRYGGPVQSTHALARGLVDLGHEVTVLTTNVDGPDRLDVPLHHPVELEGVRVYYHPIQTPQRLYTSTAMLQCADTLLPSMDIVHINGVFLLPGPLLAKAARRHGKPVVISPRGMLAPELVAAKSRFVKWAWIALLEREALAGARAIHVTSEAEADGVRRMNLDLAPLATVPNAVRQPERKPTASEIAELWGDVPQGQRVALLARLDWTKGVDLAIAAVRAHPTAVLRIAGHDQIGLRAQLESQLRRSDGTCAGAFLGHLDGARKWAFLTGADLLLAPSVTESFGMSVAEALAVGTPTIVTPSVGASTVVKRIDPGLVTERCVCALSNALSTFLSDPARRQRAGQEAKRICAIDFSSRAIAARMADVYSGLGSY